MLTNLIANNNFTIFNVSDHLVYLKLTEYYTSIISQ